jgi:ketosteroid isomerase-like protein
MVPAHDQTAHAAVAGWAILLRMGDHDELIREIVAAFNERDFDRAAAWTQDDAVFDWSRSISDNRGVHEGIGNIQALFESFLEAWQSVDWQVTAVEELGPDRLLVVTRVVARGRDSGIEIEGRGAQVWELLDGKLARATLFQSREDAKAFLDQEGADRAT